MAFQETTLPITTCRAGDCTTCPVSEAVNCHFTAAQLVHFLLISLPGFLVGGAAVWSSGMWPLLIWIVLTIGYFGFIEIRVMCSHCPHYAEEGRTLRCWANYGAPKPWRYRPGPMSTMENVVFITGLVVVWTYPIPFFITGEMWTLLGLYALVTAGFFMTLKRFLCTRCMNFACPLNGTPEWARMLFLARNPSIARAWDSGERKEGAS